MSYPRHRELHGMYMMEAGRRANTHTKVYKNCSSISNAPIKVLPHPPQCRQLRRNFGHSCRDLGNAFNKGGYNVMRKASER